MKWKILSNNYYKKKSLTKRFILSENLKDFKSYDEMLVSLINYDTELEENVL